MPSSWLFALIGGGLIGTAAALLFAAHGRIAGISGVLGALLPPAARDRHWRLAFMAGVLASGALSTVVAPQLVGSSTRSLPLVIAAGLIVGFGTRLGSGCTSGHGVCGLSRLSTRSAVAVGVFLTTGAITAWIVGAVS